MKRLRIIRFIGLSCVAMVILVIGGRQVYAQFEVIFVDPVYATRLAGHVQDPTGGEIEDAKIELVDLTTSKLLASTATDKTGDFAFKGFSKSSYRLKITRAGFNTLIVTIRIRRNALNPPVFTLPIAA